MTRKLIIHDGRVEREVLLVGTIVVGRDPSCHINDLDPLLSRRHAEFVTTPHTVTLRDLGSRNGMLVNGTKTREHVLAEGDLIQLGHLQLRYLEDRSAPTQEAVIRAHATTAAAMDSATMAVPPHDRRLPVSDLDDTKPHDHAAPQAPSDNDATRVPGRLEGPPAAANLDATVAVLQRAQAAPAAGDLDATFASGSPRDVAAAFVPASHNLDATIAPGVDFDATFVPTRGYAAPTVAPPVEGDTATLVAGLDLRVQSANAAGGQVFDATPAALIGQSLADLVSHRLQILAGGGGPAAFSVVLERRAADRTVKAIFKTGQTPETIA